MFVNGIEFNGFIFYGVDFALVEGKNVQMICDFIDTYNIWYENEYQKKYIFFGDSNISWYCFDLLDQVYVELDKPSGTPMTKYKDFNTMLEKALSDGLM